jgi:putative ABC transport system ATP-binding protein
VKEPPLVLADEPTGSLDRDTGVAILSLLRETVADGDRSVLVVTHNRAITRIAHRVIELRDGQVLDMTERGDPASPADLDW